jgi:hypothetical protein
MGPVAGQQEQPHHKTQPNEPEVAVSSSPWQAIRQVLIHIIPVLATIVLVWLNARGYFIGAQLAGPSSLSDDLKLHLLQFAAKLHELFIISSMATILYSVLRHHLLGNGVPLGALGSGQSFTSLGYFMYIPLPVVTDE